jgi:hypothetical protein
MITESGCAERDGTPLPRARVRRVRDERSQGLHGIANDIAAPTQAARPATGRRGRTLAVVGLLLVEPTGSPVQITVSLGHVLVPYLIGLSRSAATQAISNAGLTVGRVSSVNSCVDPGSVQTQNPSQGVSVAVGSTVSISVSSCTTTGSGGGTILPK